MDNEINQKISKRDQSQSYDYIGKWHERFSHFFHTSRRPEEFCTYVDDIGNSYQTNKNKNPKLNLFSDLGIAEIFISRDNTWYNFCYTTRNSITKILCEYRNPEGGE